MDKDFLFYANASIENVLRDLQTSDKGLSEQEAHKRLFIYGLNTVQQTVTTGWTILANQLSSPFVFMFVLIATLYFFTHQYTECIIILIIMMINTMIGFYQEYHSNKAMELLQRYLQATALIRRDGKDYDNAIETIVPGDIILLKIGDIIPADCRIIESNNCAVDESQLSGESVPVHKTHELPKEEIKELWQAATCGFAGTVIVDGTALVVVFATGIHSQMGSIAQLATHTIVKGNLAKNTAQLARIVLIVVLISLAIIIFINVVVKAEKTSFISMLFFAAALSITAVPSALPIVITFCLTKGAMALHKHKIIVKRLSAIEDLGAVTILCADKTGTLTENNLHITEIYNAKEYDILVLAALTSDLTKTSNSFDMAIAEKLTDKEREQIAQYSVIKILPFTYERYRTIALVKKDFMYLLITKGSFEYVMQRCGGLSADEINDITAWMKDHEIKSNRVIAVAIKHVGAHDINQDAFSDEHINYDAMGLIAFVDPLKETAPIAIKKAQELAVQIKIMSGDSRDVCFSIAQELGLEKEYNNVVLGSDFEKSSPEQKIFLANNRTIFARVTPQQKYEIIEILQQMYSVCYMGDGINDAPALKAAHVGVAVKEAAPVAREAAEIILLQKSLLYIVSGIEEGRKTIINTLKYIKITISSNIGLFCFLSLSSLWINYLPTLPLQLLFLDLITDFPLISISTDTVTHHELKQPVRYSLHDIGCTVFLFGLVCLPFYFLNFILFRSDIAQLQTYWFIISALAQFVLIFSLRTRVPFWQAPRPSLLLCALCCIAIAIVIVLPFIPLGETIFHFQVPTFHDMSIILSIICAYFATTELMKWLYYHCIVPKKAYPKTQK